MRSRFAILWIALTAVVAGIAAYIAYGAGVSTHLPEVAAGTAAGTVAPGYYYPYWHPFFGFGFFGFFFLLLILFLVFRVLFGFRRGWGHGYRRFGPGGPGGPGAPGGPGGPGGRHPIEERLEEWHRKAHESPEEAPKQS